MDISLAKDLAVVAGPLACFLFLAFRTERA